MSGRQEVPGSPFEALLEQACQLMETGQVERLRPLVLQAAGGGDAKAQGLLEASYAASLRGEYRRAHAAAVLAAMAAPVHPKVVSELLSRLRTFNDVARLRAELARVGPPARMPIPLLLMAASQLSSLNLQQEAMQLLDEAVRADPAFPPARLARGQVLRYLGRFDEAIADLDRVVRRAPEIAQAWWVLAHSRRWGADRNHVDAIRREAARPGRRPVDVAMLYFALHKELDDMGDVDGAWHALEQACQAKRASLRYAAEDSRRLVDALVAAMPGGAAACPPAPDAAGGHVPVFIVGMHRSGTTLLEQLLDGSPEVRGVGELYDFTSAMRHATDHHCRGVLDVEVVRRSPGLDYAAVGRRYMEGMAWRLGGERFFTDKLPSNFLNIGFICRALPQARILHMVRDPMETCFSNLRELFSDANAYSYDQHELADYFAQYRRLMAHWHAAFPGRILDVDYAGLTADPAAEMRRVAAFCGIDYVDAMSDPRSSKRAVATASAVQVRDRVVRREVPKWAPYAGCLAPLAEGLRRHGILVEAGTV